MKRELFGQEISQKSKSEFFSATDLVRAGNAKRLNSGKDIFKLPVYLKSKNTKEFIQSLEDKYGKVKINSRGKNGHTWVHPLLFIDIALAIDPQLKVEVYGWMFDNLIKYRNDSGDSFKKMSGALLKHCNNKRTFVDDIQATARLIRKHVGVEDWQTATQDQLKKRDKIHDHISLLCDVLKDNKQAIRIALAKNP